MSRLSVIVGTYQHGTTIARTLDAIFSQSQPADEVIVVDDGSTDNTDQRLAPYLDRISFVRQENAGAPSARNHGFRQSTGDYVLFCDADVVMRPNMLQRLKETLEAHPEVSYTYCRFRWGWKRFPCRAFDADALRKRNFIHTSAALIRRSAFAGFDESLKKFQDWDLWLTMLEQGHKGLFVNEELYTVKQERGRLNMSSWLPRVAYLLPWDQLAWKPKRIESYETAKEIIQHKHHLS